MKPKPKTSTYDYPKPNKQHDMRGASLLRMAKEHSGRAKGHRLEAKRNRESCLEYLHRGIAIGHEESALILRDEAKRLRGMR